MLSGENGRKITFFKGPNSWKLAWNISHKIVWYRTTVGFCIMWIDSSKEPLIFYRLSFGAVHCSTILWISGYWDYCQDIPTHFDAFLDILWVSAAFKKCRVVIIFFFFHPRCTVLYIGIFFVQKLGENVKGGKLCSSTFIFMWSKQWEGALLWCTNLVIVSWLTEIGFYMMSHVNYWLI